MLPELFCNSFERATEHQDLFVAISPMPTSVRSGHVWTLEVNACLNSLRKYSLGSLMMLDRDIPFEQ